MLNRLAIRLCAVKALAGKTFAGDAVRDSQITMVDAAARVDEPRPFIAVYTDDQSSGNLSLTLEIGATARMSTFDEQGSEIIIAGVPPTDAGIEITLDLIERQVRIALADDGNEWAELFRVAYPASTEFTSTRGAAKTSDGERFAGRQIILNGKPLADPAFGQAVKAGSFWQRFLDRADDESDLAQISALMRGLIDDPGNPADWQQLQRALAVSRVAADALGIGPGIGDDVAPVSIVEIDGPV